MQSNMNLKDYDVVEWSDSQPTYFVSDSMLQVMHQDAEKEGLVQKNTHYTNRTEKLNFIRVKYAVDQDTVRRTFYLDELFSGVVAVKGN